VLPVGGMVEAVALLVEMRADEAACRHASSGSLAAALRRIGSSGTVAPQGTLGMSDRAVAARLARITMPRHRLPPAVASLIVLCALVLVSTPVTFFLLPT
jgi:hypothetical protein